MTLDLSKCPPPNPEERDFPVRIVLITHLMTCYAIRPSGQVAHGVAEHMKVLLESTETDVLDAWFPRFEILYTHWRVIAAQYTEGISSVAH